MASKGFWQDPGSAFDRCVIVFLVSAGVLVWHAGWLTALLVAVMSISAALGLVAALCGAIEDSVK